MMEKVSVIIPVYNREQYIEECIDSLQKQTYQDLEILLIDDGSTDSTVEICTKLANNDPRIVLLKGEHGGVSKARNKGLDAATGKYVFFLDSDDVIHPMLLEALVTAMENTDAPLGGTSCCNVGQAYWHKVAEVAQKDAGPAETEYIEHKEVLRRVFAETTPINLVGGVMMRRDWVGQTRFREDLYIGEDFYFVYENLIKGASTIFLRQKWYYCRLHDRNSSWDFQLSGFMNRLRRRELVWESEEALGRPENARRQKAEAFSFFWKFLKQDTMQAEEKRKMCQVMKQYRNTIFPALGVKMKLVYIAGVYFPALCEIAFRLKKKCK